MNIILGAWTPNSPLPTWGPLSLFFFGGGGGGEGAGGGVGSLPTFIQTIQF